jgi:hypothetical protein
LTRHISILPAISLFLWAVASASAQDHFTFHENAQVGQTYTYYSDSHASMLRDTIVGDHADRLDFQFRQLLKCSVKILAVTDGSPTQIQIYVDPTSHDTFTDSDGMQIYESPFADQTVTLRMRDDQWIHFNFPGKASPLDLQLVKQILTPDDIFYPDHPVAIGDIWDITPKAIKFAHLAPTDQLMAQCRLDSIDDKHKAHISCSLAGILEQPGKVECDEEYTAKMKVDLALGKILLTDAQAVNTYSTPADAPARITGREECHYHTVVSLPTTRP